jgi:hypothetical protein
LNTGCKFKPFGRAGSFNVTSSTRSSDAKTKFSALALLATTLLLTAFVSGCCARQASSSLGSQILQLKPGETHLATSNEVWHSAARYAALEQELINCVATLKQRENH